VAFLLEQFNGSGLVDPVDPNHGVDVDALAARSVDSYARYKADKKSSGNLDIQKLPGVNHPVFKDKPVNHDPREIYIGTPMQRRGEHNVFHDFYRALVQKLYADGVSRNVYCGNVDAVIAALLLKTVWPAGPRTAAARSAPTRWRRPHSRSSCTPACWGARPKSTIT
jgi:hypothetical protein